MAWYTSGSVSVANGDTLVTGSGTQFVSNTKAGDIFICGDDGMLYEIDSIISATQLNLKRAYVGATKADADYAIIPTATYLKTLASQVTDLIALYSNVPQGVQDAQEARDAAQASQTAASASADAAHAALVEVQGVAETVKDSITQATQAASDAAQAKLEEVQTVAATASTNVQQAVQQAADNAQAKLVEVQGVADTVNQTVQQATQAAVDAAGVSAQAAAKSAGDAQTALQAAQDAEQKAEQHATDAAAAKDAADASAAASAQAKTDAEAARDAAQAYSVIAKPLSDFPTVEDFPAPGEAGKVYAAVDTGRLYRWDGSQYVELSPSPQNSDAVPEGSTNLYYTASRVLDALQQNAAGARTALSAYSQAQVDAALTAKLTAASNLADLGNAATARTNLGLGNVNNTSDADKPVSTAQQAALNARLPVSGGVITGNLGVAGTSSFAGLSTYSGRIQLYSAGIMNVFLSATSTGFSVTNAADNTYLAHVRNSDGSGIFLGSVYSGGGGNGMLNVDGNVYGTCWGGWLSNWLNGQLGGKVSVVGGVNRAGLDGGNVNLPCFGYSTGVVYVVRNLDTTCQTVRRLNGYLEWGTDIGAVGTNYFGSDRKLKREIKPSETRALDTLSRMQFYSFRYKEGVGFDHEQQHHVGVIAQELRDLDPTFVTELSDGTLYANVFTLLNFTMKALVEANERINELEKRIDG